jgi:hypothetical protein
MSGAQGSLSWQCGLPGPFGLITAGALCVSWFGDSSLLSSGHSEHAALSTGSLSSAAGTLVSLTSSLTFPRYGSLVCRSCRHSYHQPLCHTTKKGGLMSLLIKIRNG